MTTEARKRIKRAIHQALEGKRTPGDAMKDIYEIADSDEEWDDGEGEEDNEEDDEGDDEENDEEDDEEDGPGFIEQALDWLTGDSDDE